LTIQRRIIDSLPNFTKPFACTNTNNIMYSLPGHEADQAHQRPISERIRSFAPYPLRSSREDRRRFDAFTLIELLTVITIIGILAAIILPTASRVRASARTARCISNLRQLVIAAQLHAADNRDTVVHNTEKPAASGGTKTWCQILGPYAYSDKPTAITSLQDKGIRPPGIFACPAGAFLITASHQSDYGKNFLVNGQINPDPADNKNSGYKYSQVQPAAHVVLFLDATERDFTGFSASKLALRHSEKANLAYFDGHVKTRALPEIPLGGAEQKKLPWTPQK
jgi:prepilin-type N-terminal cleavage/methylation domain-containing protein/prepilin-type processing-associated H-X9-DG protein